MESGLALRAPRNDERACASRLSSLSLPAFRPVLAFALQGLAHGLELLERRRIDARELQIEAFERGDDGRADHDAGEPFVIGRHDMPRRRWRRGVPDDVLIDRLIALPARALGNVAHRELPVFRRLLQPGQEALALLLFGDVEEELQDDCAVAREIALEGGDVLEALLPDVLGDEPWRQLLGFEDLGMDARDQAFLVVGTVEDANAAAL